LFPSHDLEGYEIDKEKSTLGHVVFKKIEEINTMEDVYRLNGTTKWEFERKWEGFEPYQIAAEQERLIVSAYNKGELPDWDNSDQAKYYPYFKMGSGKFSYYFSLYHYTSSSVASRLCFLREEDLEDAVSKFLHIYKVSRLC
jgi:hypothetical protein